MYGTVSGVAAMVPSVGTISSTSTPTETHVLLWLNEASARIDRHLSSAGYSVPVDATAALASELGGLAQLYAAAYTLRARGLDSVTGVEDSRSAVWLAEFRDALMELVQTDLTAQGASQTTTAKKRRGVRSMQLRRVDGYSGAYEGDTAEYDNVSE